MAETTNYNLPYPNDYSADADVPLDFKKLAQKVDEVLLSTINGINGNIEDLSEGLEETYQSLVQTQQHFVINENETLRIWDLEAGVHYLDGATVIYYAGATNIKAKLIDTDYGFSGGILIITDSVSVGGFTGKTWMLFTNGHYYDGEKESNGFIILGFTTETNGEFYEYAIEDLDNVKKAVEDLELDVSKLEQYRTEQAEQIQALQQENALLKEQIPTRTSKRRKYTARG